MNKPLLLGLCLFSTLNFPAQESTKDLRQDIEDLKISVKNLHTEIQSVKSENIYLKKALDINQPILEVKGENTTYKITKVQGDKSKKLVTITLLIEPIHENESFYIDECSTFDIEGNEIKMDYFKSEEYQGEIFLNTPKKIKLTFVYKDVEEGMPQIIKLLRFKNRYHTKNTGGFGKSERIEFKDFKVTYS